ncbi:MAG: tRNA guanosine(34) transglycosylase Tgt [Parcubacteria group bacterium]|nr:tRNA guanosine(34) transglycosylase Tgt [Parcubacteria group bacterium]
MNDFSFKITGKDKNTRARAGILTTPCGKILTPAFVPVATKAAVKGMDFNRLEEIGFDILMVNTYHLFLRPGHKVVAKAGGLHKFANWRRPLMTDSGGFQVFSLGFGLEHGVGKIGFFPGKTKAAAPGRKKLVEIDEEGASFVSFLDGSRHRITPEKSIEIQRALGADIIFAFDECTSPLASYEYTAQATARTHRWAKRCLKVFKGGSQAMFGIVQGGAYKDLRIESARVIGAMPFFGIGVGGSLGKTKREMRRVLDWTLPVLPEEKPRHLLGIGEISDIFEAVERGADLFDCVIPTRLARHGVALTKKGRVNLANGKFLTDQKPIEKECLCQTCRKHSRAYLSHLTRSKEILGIMLLTEHNLFFMKKLMTDVRQAILDGGFSAFKKKMLR